MIAFDEAATSLESVIAAGTEATVALAPPRSADDELAVDIHLLAFNPGAPQRHRDLVQRPGSLEFMVAVTGPGDRVAGAVHDVCLAIDESTDHELLDDGVPLEWWLAFGVGPRPAVRVATAVVIDRPVATAPEVTETLVIEPRFIARRAERPDLAPAN